MKVIVKARHMNLTPALKRHATEKISDAVMRIFDRPALKMEIELSDLGHVHDGSKECRVTVSMPHGKPITIREIDDDLFTAINLAHDRLLLQVKRQRGKRNNTSSMRKFAQKSRNEQAQRELTVAPEPWETEVREYEASQSP